MSVASRTGVSNDNDKENVMIRIKKTKQSKAAMVLTLDTETIRTLDASQLPLVSGGRVTASNYPTCV